MKNLIKKLEPSINIATVEDGRGGILTFIPEDSIVEFNLIFYNKNIQRGNHYHSEFDEYILVVSGEGLIVNKDIEQKIFVSKGSCVCIPKGTIHTFYAITDCMAVSFLTKKWDECNEPLIKL